VTLEIDLHLPVLTVLVVNFPKPQSPLLDLRVIVGSEQLLAGLVKKFEEHITEERSVVWKSLEWFTNDL